PATYAKSKVTLTQRPADLTNPAPVGVVPNNGVIKCSKLVVETAIKEIALRKRLVQPYAGASLIKGILSQIIAILPSARKGRIVLHVMSPPALKERKANPAPVAFHILHGRLVVDLNLREEVGRQIIEAQYRLELDPCLGIVSESKVRPAQPQVRCDPILVQL